MIFKCMLATDANLELLRFPLLASPKLDGVRAVVRSGIVYSRGNKPIPNQLVQKTFSRFEHCDGELIAGNPTSATCYRDTVSEVMSADKQNGCSFFVFDHIEFPQSAYQMRARKLTRAIGKSNKVKLVEQTFITNLDELLAHEMNALSAGYEGLILRDLNAPYKNGRSTINEGYLLKLKRFVDGECIITGFTEREKNTNEAKVNETGHTSRSSHKAGKVGRGDLGALLVRSANGVEFSIGTGFSDEERKRLWDNRGALIGKMVKFKHFPIGEKVAPRHPVFLGFRSKLDL